MEICPLHDLLIVPRVFLFLFTPVNASVSPLSKHRELKIALSTIDIDALMSTMGHLDAESSSFPRSVEA